MLDWNHLLNYWNDLLDAGLAGWSCNSGAQLWKSLLVKNRLLGALVGVLLPVLSVLSVLLCVGLLNNN